MPTRDEHVEPAERSWVSATIFVRVGSRRSPTSRALRGVRFEFLDAARTAGIAVDGHHRSDVGEASISPRPMPRRPRSALRVIEPEPSAAEAFGATDTSSHSLSHREINFHFYNSARMFRTCAGGGRRCYYARSIRCAIRHDGSRLRAQLCTSVSFICLNVVVLLRRRAA